MEDNKLVKFKEGELGRIGNSIAITNKLLSQRNNLKILVVFIDIIIGNHIRYTFQCKEGYEIDEAEIDEKDYENALIKSRQKKYDVILITTMFNALELTSKIKEDNINKNALIYILSSDRNFCAKNPKEFNIAGFMIKDDFFISYLIEEMESIRNKFNK